VRCFSALSLLLYCTVMCSPFADFVLLAKLVLAVCLESLVVLNPVLIRARSWLWLLFLACRGTAEALAFGSLLEEGVHVRLS
jgi:hypothetical protein